MEPKNMPMRPGNLPPIIRPRPALALVMLTFALASAWAGSDTPPDGALRGADIYRYACAKCHDRGLNGAPRTDSRSAWIARVPEWAAVLEGHAVNGWIDMPAKGGHRELTDSDVESAVAYIRERLGAAATASLGSDAALGRRTYLMACAGCHDSGLEGAPRIGDATAWRWLSPAAAPTVKSHAVKGYFKMAPKGGYPALTDKQVESAVTFMMQKSSGRQ